MLQHHKSVKRSSSTSAPDNWEFTLRTERCSRKPAPLNGTKEYSSLSSRRHEFKSRHAVESPAESIPRKRVLSVGVENSLETLASNGIPSCWDRRPTPAAKQAMAHIDEDYYNATMTKAKRDADRIKEKIAEQEKLSKEVNALKKKRIFVNEKLSNFKAEYNTVLGDISNLKRRLKEENGNRVLEILQKIDNRKLELAENEREWAGKIKSL